MKLSVEKGFIFGLTSSVITALGLMIGLDAATNSKLAVVGGIVAIAIADACSDAISVHSIEEAEKRKQKQVWESAYSAFSAKLLFTLTFLIPVLLFPLKTAIMVAIVWGILLISGISYRAARSLKQDPKKLIVQHLLLMIIVLFITYYVGRFVSYYFT